MKTKEIVIRFVGKRKIYDGRTGRERLVAADPPTVRTNGNRIIELPSGDEQKKGFTHPDAEFLLKNYRAEFKRKTRKGK